ncbi:protein piccolo isoform X5 [Drosophila ananassae]|uniref:protein piccolo isoform X5 n=1 Tax=Drosophila ananassae TaxID=7217 RepID=UPI0013A5BDD5|nr:protein piccolo isoform X5 [Drosophila ananassae]
MATSAMQSAASSAPGSVSANNPQLKRVVYSKYRELLGSYNDKANAIIDTLPAYMVHKDRGFQLPELHPVTNGDAKNCLESSYGQRGGGGAGNGGYEAPACVQNAMMTKDKKPFTYTPGGIDLSQIRSERMAKRLARNAQSEGATGASQQNRPAQPQSPGGGAASAMGAAAMGMPFQVLPPPPPPQPLGQTGKNGTSAAAAAAPPPPPPQQPSTLAPPTGRLSAPGSPATARKSPTPQRFEPPPLGFRPEIKIPPNPMAALRKVPPPVEKNTFWKDEYCKDRSKSPLPEVTAAPTEGYTNGNSNSNGNGNGNSSSNSPSDVVDAPRSAPAPSVESNNGNSYIPYTPTTQQQPPVASPKTPPMPQQQPTPPATPPQQEQQQQPTQTQPQQVTPQQEQEPQQLPSQFRSVAMPTSPAVNVYTRQTESPRSPFEQQQRSTESPFRYAQQQQSPQQRPPAAISPLAQVPQQQQSPQQRPPAAISPLAQVPQQQQSPQQRPPAAISPLAQVPQQQQQQQSQQQAAQSVPWRTQRQPGPQQQQQQLQSHPQPIYNNVQQQQQQRSRDVFSPARTETGATSFQQQQQQQNFGPQTQNQYAAAAKPTNVGSLYIAPLAQPTEPQAQRILLQQQQQQAGARDSPMRQLPQQQQSQQPQGNQNLRWLTSQPASKEQAPWALGRPEENGNVLPSTLRQTTPQPQSQTSFYQLPQLQPQTGNGYGPSPVAAAPIISQHNFGSNPQPGGLRLQINLNTNGSSSNNNANPSAPRERIIPITLEQTPTYAAAQPNFGAPAGHIIRSANQFVDQGYNNYAAPPAGQWREPSSQRVLSPSQPPVNASTNGTATRIIPIAIEGGRGGPVSQSPVLLQNDPRSPPIQSKSFRILQKITDTVDDGSDGAPQHQQQQSPQQTPQEAELQRPQFARQMSAQQARNSPTIEQMRRLQIAQDQQQYQSGTPLAWSPQGNGVSAQNRFTQQRYDTPQQQQKYVPPSEQQVPEPKKYTGSAIPSRSFKILQAMTTPENADHKNHTELDSDLENVELNENPININNNNNNENKNNHNKINNKTNKRHSYTSATPTPPPTTYSTDPATHSSNSSLNSDSSCAPQPPRSQSVPPHYPYAFGYPYPWYMPPPPPPNGEGAAPWPYPYPYPPPPPPPHTVDGKPAEGYPYPYYYPYYPPPPMPPYGQQAGETQSPAAYPPFYGHPYPYPVAPSYSQSSTEESRASSILPDIIITPSTDDMPSQVIMQHHIRVEPREPPKRAHSVEIEELVSRPKARNICTNNQQVIDVLSQRLANISKIAGGNTQANLSKQLQKNYAGEHSKELGERSPSENASNSDSESSDESSDEDDEVTPKMGARPAPLQAIKSVTNVQVYKGKSLERHLDSESSDDDEDVTTADEMYDEEEQVELEQEGLVEEMEEDYIVEEDLSVIYEEESELERSSEYAKTVVRNDSRSTIVDEIDKQIEENDDDDEESNSVTVRLPLRFSFSRNTNDEDVATVQVGSTTQVEEKRPSIASSFSVAKVESEDEDEDDCDVSVTISLSNSSRSNSVEKATQPYKTSSAYPVEEMAVPRKTSIEDDTNSFSLGMRNKFLGDTMSSDVTNNISRVEGKPKIEEVKEVASSPKEEFDFFATLMATKMQAQKMMEQSKNFWKTPEAKPADQTAEVPKLRSKENALESKPPRPKSADVSKTQASLEAAKNSFWSTFATASQEAEPSKEPEEKPEEVDFWASIEKKESSDVPDKKWTKKKKTVTYTPLKKETVTSVEHWTTTLRARVDSLPSFQRAEVHFIVEEKPEQPKKDEGQEEDEEEDFWASVEKAKAVKSSEKISNTNLESSTYNQEPQMETESTMWIDQSKEDYSSQPAEDEVDFWADIQSSTSIQEEEKPQNMEYDPTKYPEEPREVDTDEEIDFWAEIEANRKPGEDDDEDVTFHKSATFWARKERQNSVEETPYKPVETKAFRAKLPDEPAVEIDVWATLEAARGEEPVIVDPVIEEENVLAEQYEDLEHDAPEEDEDKNKAEHNAKPQEPTPESNLSHVDTMSMASMHEPATVYTWSAPPQEEQEEEVDFWADIENERAKKEQVEEAEQKRQNYRQAMAFFNTSIDGQQTPPQASPQKGNRSSVILEAEEPQDLDLGPPGEYEIVGEDGGIVEEHKPQIPEVEEEERGAPTPTPTNSEPQLPEVYVEPEPEVKLLPNGLPDLGVEKFSAEAPKISVRDRISAFEVVPTQGSKALTTQSLSVDSGVGKGTLSRNSSTQRSESEIEEDDSGVTDMNRHLSETDTESESFPELRKMSSYQRAATHSRLFKLLNDENDLPEDPAATPADEFQLKPSRRKIVHNVSITRKQNPSALSDAESMSQRRERLSLPLRKNTSIDADNPSTPNSPASPIMGPSAKNQKVVSDKLVNELVQSLLLKSDSTHLRNLPMEKLQAAAKRALAEEMDSAQNSSLDSTPAPTPKHDKEYSDYYNSWCEASGSGDEVLPSKAFRNLQDPRRSPWTVRCPRVLSSKTINRDLARVTESPEIANARGSKSPECFRQNSQSRERSVSSWRRV